MIKFVKLTVVSDNLSEPSCVPSSLLSCSVWEIDASVGETIAYLAVASALSAVAIFAA